MPYAVALCPSWSVPPPSAPVLHPPHDAGLLKIHNIDVRYQMGEDPKVLLSVGLSLPPKQVYTHLAWGPDNYIAGAQFRV
jgi:hypothetical protein